jgi:hypothetical protein
LSAMSRSRRWCLRWCLGVRGYQVDWRCLGGR